MTIILVPILAFILSEIGTSIFSIPLNKLLSAIFPCYYFCTLQYMEKLFCHHVDRATRRECRRAKIEAKRPARTSTCGAGQALRFLLKPANKNQALICICWQVSLLQPLYYKKAGPFASLILTPFLLV